MQNGCVHCGEYQRWKQKEEKDPQFPGETQTVGKLKYNKEEWSYLWYPDFPAGLQEVLHISPTLGHAELGLEREPWREKTEGWGRLSSSAQTDRDLPRQAREHGCPRLNWGECDWRGGRAQLHPSETVPGPQGGWASVGSRCSEENRTKIIAEVMQIINSSNITLQVLKQRNLKMVWILLLRLNDIKWFWEWSLALEPTVVQWLSHLPV